MDFFFLEAHALMQNPPAHAGNTLDKNATVTIAQDHPRLRGEYNHIKIDGQEYLGSPPLTRGIPMHYSVKRAPGGITPACAGNTAPFPTSCRTDKDHPRLRGENFLCRSSLSVRLGSPPLARGKPFATSSPCVSVRITPACAGKTAIL